MVSVKQAPTRYFFEFGGAVLLFMGAMALRGYTLRHGIAPVFVKDLFLISPIFALFLGAFAMYRFYLNIDELMRRRLLTILAVSAATTALFSMSYGFLGVFGFRALSLGAAFFFMMGTWFIVALFSFLRDAVAGYDIRDPSDYVPLIGYSVGGVLGLIGVSARLTGWITPNSLYPLIGMAVTIASFWLQRFLQRRAE